MFSLFFINRPIFAKVISIFLIIIGLIGINFLPIAQYPTMSPPMVQVTAIYTGGNAEDVENSVTRPLEAQINGVEGMIYMTSTSASNGTSLINVYFEPGYPLSTAAVDVQNTVNVALPQLPEAVKSLGVSTKKKSPDMVEVISVTSSTNQRSNLFLSNFAALNIVDELKRIDGVGDVILFGERKYAVRIWLDTDLLANLKLTPMDVTNAIKEQNIQISLGGIGKSPTPSNVDTQYILTALTQFSEIEEFKNIIILANTDGTLVKLKDIARVELGAENYDSFSKTNNQDSANIGVYQLPSGNSIQIADDVQAKLKELQKRFPSDIQASPVYDTTQFVRITIDDVIKTLFEAVALVIFVVFIFLQSWRATLIPAMAIPVSLIGTFALLLMIGFSINFLTLFGLILAIGIVVDDSIIVLENVERNLQEHPDLSVKDASIIAMKELSGPIVATTLVLMAVFIPVMFIPGISGAMYQQFAVTIVFSVILSAINALTLSPVLANMMLRKEDVLSHKKGFLFTLFNKGFDAFTKAFEIALRKTVKFWYVSIVLYLLALAMTYVIFVKLPSGFIPQEDQGTLMAMVSLRPGIALDTNKEVSHTVADIIMKTEGVANIITIGGRNIIDSSIDSSATSMFIILKDWDERYEVGLTSNKIKKELLSKLQDIDKAKVVIFDRPSIPGLSPVGGFELQVQDYSSGSLSDFSDQIDMVMQKAKKDERFMFISSTFKTNYPQLFLDIDRDKVKTLNLNINDVFESMNIYLGSSYVNDFKKFGKIYRVYVQAEVDERAKPQDIKNIFVRNNEDKMVPLSSVLSIKKTVGPSVITHYNMQRSVTIRGVQNVYKGYSSGDAMNAIQEICDETLDTSKYGYSWSGLSLQQSIAGNAALYIFMLSVLFAFLFMAANYESWLMSLIILIPIPAVILGSLLGTMLTHQMNSIYVQIGMVLLVGMSAKNAILVVEFAKELQLKGQSIKEAAINAAVIRLRPILMTIFAFLLGVLPLVLATGAGAAARNAIGTGVFWGMVMSTVLTLFFTPVIYILLEELHASFSKQKNKELK